MFISVEVWFNRCLICLEIVTNWSQDNANKPADKQFTLNQEHQCTELSDWLHFTSKVNQHWKPCHRQAGCSGQWHQRTINIQISWSVSVMKGFPVIPLKKAKVITYGISLSGGEGAVLFFFFCKTPWNTVLWFILCHVKVHLTITAQHCAETMIAR